MNNTLKMTLFWVLAIIITLSAASYQRLTGPTHPKRVSLNINDINYKLKLVRSHNKEADCPIKFEIPDQTITGSISYRRYLTNDQITRVELKREGNMLVGSLPQQPPAGKIQYYIQFNKDGRALNNKEEFSAIIRFTGSVPTAILLPHVLFMFLAMLFANLAGILAIAKHKKMVLYTNLTLILFVLGGMILGPLVQLNAFGELWTGFSNGKDLTDNKTLIALIFWIIAVVMNRKQQKPVWIIVAAVVMLAIYLIPHIALGSELDYEAGKVVTG
jgi:hypothetical protein